LLCYYKELDNDSLINEKDEIILKNDLTSLELSNNFDVENITRMDTRTLTTISYVPRAYSYNPNGICGSTAAAIFLMYYDDHVNDNYIPSAYESSGTGEKTVKYLKGYIDGSTPGSTYSDMKSGLNKYLSIRGFSQSATILSTSNVLGPIGSNRPVIVGLAGHPKYGNHWVVGYGYNRYVEGTTTIYMIVVSDGWGKTGVYVNRTYCDGGVKI
jgi:hypothetical protein